MYNIINKNKYFILVVIVFITQLLVLSCKNNTKRSSLVQDGNCLKSSIEVGSKIDYKYYDVLNIMPVEIIFPKNQTVAQGLSVLVNDGYGNLIVFDGGRVEDADYLCDIIKDKGGIVKTWFITHIHDDHIGALYKILSDKRIDITIEEIVYDFADFDWYYSKMGNDAGMYYLFENAIKEYNDSIKSLFNRSIFVNNDKKDFIYPYKDLLEQNSNMNENYGNTSLEVYKLNDIYKLNQDPINNTSIVYLVVINGIDSMIVFGDLGYEGGKELFSNINNKSKYIQNKFFNSSIITLSHHGQNGIDPELYKKFTPKVVIWPTSKDIYENKHGTYYTDDTKRVLSEIDSLKYQIKTYEETAIIR